ncbi:MAG: imidazole glycerol phosphate synthase subunit HisH [Phycisphaeraceae bacterium]|nr:imidazole glycerol phosphate synthase subunit HisH [Phycisphaeraceae bacterium]
MIGIIDYGMGNLRSVQKAFELVGAEARILPSPAEMDGVKKLILPGVGAFADGMINLRNRGWIDPIHAFIATGKPFLGICLGLQLVFESSQEDAPSPDQPVPGLGVFKGQVVQFRQQFDAQGQPLIKIPHMGWNTIRWTRQDPLLADLPVQAGTDPAVYFVHSYYALPDVRQGSSFVSATAEYPVGQPFCATVWRDNVWATQFHPEKSQRVGLAMLRNFARF